MKKILPLLLLLTACASPGPPPPPPEVNRLAPVIAELQIAEALANEIPVLLRDSMRELFFDRTLSDHQLDRPTFDSLLWIVRAEPEWIDSMYTQAGDILTRWEVERSEQDEE